MSETIRHEEHWFIERMATKGKWIRALITSESRPLRRCPTEGGLAILSNKENNMRMKSFRGESYDDAVAYLTAHPEEIYEAWNEATDEVRGGCLFAYATKKDEDFHCTNIGCLTMIRHDRDARELGSEFGPEITQAIRDDERIPDEGDDITVEHLPVFAEWQRRLDDLVEQPKARRRRGVRRVTRTARSARSRRRGTVVAGVS